MSEGLMSIRAKRKQYSQSQQVDQSQQPPEKKTRNYIDLINEIDEQEPGNFRVRTSFDCNKMKQSQPTSIFENRYLFKDTNKDKERVSGCYTDNSLPWSPLTDCRDNTGGCYIYKNNDLCCRTQYQNENDFITLTPAEEVEFLVSFGFMKQFLQYIDTVNIIVDILYSVNLTKLEIASSNANNWYQYWQRLDARVTDTISNIITSVSPSLPLLLPSLESLNMNQLKYFRQLIATESILIDRIFKVLPTTLVVNNLNLLKESDFMNFFMRVKKHLTGISRILKDLDAKINPLILSRPTDSNFGSELEEYLRSDPNVISQQLAIEEQLRRMNTKRMPPIAASASSETKMPKQREIITIDHDGEESVDDFPGLPLSSVSSSPLQPLSSFESYIDQNENKNEIEDYDFPIDLQNESEFGSVSGLEYPTPFEDRDNIDLPIQQPYLEYVNENENIYPYPQQQLLSSSSLSFNIPTLPPQETKKPRYGSRPLLHPSLILPSLSRQYTPLPSSLSLLSTLPVPSVPLGEQQIKVKKTRTAGLRRQRKKSVDQNEDEDDIGGGRGKNNGTTKLSTIRKRNIGAHDDICLQIPRELLQRPIGSCDYKNLKPHQAAVVNWMIIKEVRGLLVAHTPGSGKTMTAIVSMLCCFAMDPTLKICFLLITKSTMDQWIREFENCDNNYLKIPDNIVIRLDSKIIRPAKSNTNSNTAHQIIEIMTIQGFQNEYGFKLDQLKKRGLAKLTFQIPKCANSMLVVDESQLLKGELKGGPNNASGIMTANILACARKSKKVLLLSGTITPNDTYDVVNYIAIIDGQSTPPITKSQWKIMSDDDKRKYLHCKVSYYDCNWRTGPREFLKYFPRVNEIYKIIFMTPAYLEEYTKIENEAKRKSEEDDHNKFHSKDNNDSKISQAFYHHLRTSNSSIPLESPKIEWLMNAIILPNVHNRTGKKIMIFSQFIDSGVHKVAQLLDRLEAKMNEDDNDDIELYTSITGEMNLKDRNLFVSRYMARDDQRVYLATDLDKLSRDVYPFLNKILNPDSESKTKTKSKSKSESKIRRDEYVILDREYWSQINHKKLPKHSYSLPVNIILLGPAGREGLNLKGTDIEVALDAGWNLSNQDQFEARGIRMYATEDEAKKQSVDVYLPFLLKPIQDMKTNHLNINNFSNDTELFENILDSIPRDMSTREILETYGIDMYLWYRSLIKQEDNDIFTNTIVKPSSIERNITCRNTYRTMNVMDSSSSASASSSSYLSSSSTPAFSNTFRSNDGADSSSSSLNYYDNDHYDDDITNKYQPDYQQEQEHEHEHERDHENEYEYDHEHYYHDNDHNDMGQEYEQDHDHDDFIRQMKYYHPF